MEKTNLDLVYYQNLAQDLISKRITMCWKELFDMPLRNYDRWNSVEGDIVECGVWRGGSSIFYSKLFQDKNIWCYDSYAGFQPLNETTYEFSGERHVPEYTEGFIGPLAISLEEVKFHFKNYGLDNDSRITFVEGFVNKTLPISPVEKISILRLDVDSYSATLDILDHLYHKVQPGGCIIFDDANLTESVAAIREFLMKANLPLELHNPYTDEVYSIDDGEVTQTDSGFHSNSYIYKK